MDHGTVMATARPFFEGLDGRHLWAVLLPAVATFLLGLADWRHQNRQLKDRVRELEAEIAALDDEAEQRSRELLAQLRAEDARAGAAA